MSRPCRRRIRTEPRYTAPDAVDWKRAEFRNQVSALRTIVEQGVGNHHGKVDRDLLPTFRIQRTTQRKAIFEIDRKPALGHLLIDVVRGMDASEAVCDREASDGLHDRGSRTAPEVLFGERAIGPRPRRVLRVAGELCDGRKFGNVRVQHELPAALPKSVDHNALLGKIASLYDERSYGSLSASRS